MSTTAARTTASTGRGRLLTVLAAVVAAVVVWVIAVPVLGNELLVPQGAGKDPFEIAVPFVIVSALLPALAGWGLLALLERRSGKARKIWTIIAVVALLISFAPLAGPDIETSTRVWLGLMHLAVAAVLIPGLTRGSAGRSDA
ncbi:DUF6069 family protein [Streptomyces sp. NPDC047928]|uniref:DUF6069 family protein n=1 Tax=unclassified Streptomyces TaxID=2593676 RepID=UPI00371FF26B